MSSSIKKEPNDAFDARCVKVEPNEFDAFAIPSTSTGNGRRSRARRRRGGPSLGDGQMLDEEKKPKLPENETDSSSENDDEQVSNSRKRKANSPIEEYYTNVKIGQHECDINKLFKKRKRGDLIEALRQGLSDSEPLVQEPKMEKRHEIENTSVYKILKSLKLTQNFKLPLSLDTFQPGSQIFGLPFLSKDYKWKNDVYNPIVEAVDRNIKEITTSILVHQIFHHKELSTVLGDLNDVVKFEGCTNRWNWFGSYLTGFVCLDSAIHLHFECQPIKKKRVSGKVPVNIVNRVYEFAKAEHKKFQSVTFKECLRFPCVKIWHKHLKKEIEITFSTDLNSCEMLLAKSLLMKFYLKMSPVLKQLFLFVRIIFQKYHIHGTDVKFRSYTIFWFVVFFMQLKKLLPAVIDLRKATKVKHYVAGWDCTLPGAYSYSTEPVSIYSLLLQFFDFYKNFDFLHYVICPYLGRVFRLSDFEQSRLPTEEFSLYLRQVNNPLQLTFVRNVINIQDPCDLSCNVTAHVEPNNLTKFNIVCRRLCERLPNTLEQMETMDCFCNIFVNKNFDDCSAFTHYGVYVLPTKQFSNVGEKGPKKLNQLHILEAIRRIMELTFKFEKKSIVINQNVARAEYKSDDDITIIRETFPVIYFEYCSSNSTWENDFFKEIVHRKEDEKEQIKICLICDVCLEKDFIKIFVGSDVKLVNFLGNQLFGLITFTLEEVVPRGIR